jgi:hypothetical protein
MTEDQLRDKVYRLEIEVIPKLERAAADAIDALTRRMITVERRVRRLETQQ